MLRTERARTVAHEPSRSTTAGAMTAAELAALELRVKKSLQRGDSAAYEAGQLFDQIARGLAYRERWGTLEAYADATFAEGFSTLKMYRRVASAFPKATVRKYGMTRLNAGLSYLDLLPDHHRAYDVLHLEIPLRAKRGATGTSVPFAKATVTQIQSAIDDKQSKPLPHDDKATAALKTLRNDLQQFVAAPKGVIRHAPAARAHLSDDHHVRFDLIGIDHDDLQRIAKALTAFSKRHPAPKKPARNARRSSGA